MGPWITPFDEQMHVLQIVSIAEHFSLGLPTLVFLTTVTTRASTSSRGIVQRHSTRPHDSIYSHDRTRPSPMYYIRQWEARGIVMASVTSVQFGSRAKPPCCKHTVASDRD